MNPTIKRTLIFTGFVAFAIILFIDWKNDNLWNAIALAGLMIYFWIFEVIPVYVTALFPVIFAVPLGLMEPAELAKSYGNNNVYLFFGGFILALGLEKWKVHEQVARGIINLVGQSKPRILFGFLMSTGLISMWISNTATALMMLPMAMAIVHALPKEDQTKKFAIFLLLSVAYASSIGGVGTLIGSPPNVQMASILENSYHVKIDFFQWMKIGLPLAITMLLITFLVFYLLMGTEKKDTHSFDIKRSPWTREQLRVMMIFLGVVILWSFKDLITPLIGFTYNDENVAILGGILMFLIPSTDKNKPLLSWKDTEKLPWGILILFGGGLALASIMEKNGVIEELSILFQGMKAFPFAAIIIILIVTSVFASEVLSNLAMVSIFVPLVAQFGLETGIPLEKLAIPLTLGASLAFMLPVGTPPNAIVFSSGLIQVKQMVKYGFILNLISIVLIFIFSLLML